MLVGAGAERDLVAVTTPGYPVPERGARFAGAGVVPVPLDPAAGWLPAVDSIDEATWRRLALLWINTPNNPTGAVAPRAFLSELAEQCRRRGVVLASDEAYSEIWLEGDAPASALQSGDPTHVLAFHSLSKRSSMPGYRSGFVAGDPLLIAALGQVRPNLGVTPQAFVQRASIAAWSDEAHVEQARARYRAKRDVLLPALHAAGLQPAGGPGGFFVWCRVPGDATPRHSPSGCSSTASSSRRGPSSAPAAPVTCGSRSCPSCRTSSAPRRSSSAAPRSSVPRVTNELLDGGAWGAGLATVASGSGRVLDTLFPAPALGAPPAAAPAGTTELDAPTAAALGAADLLGAAAQDDLRGVRTVAVVTVVPDLDAAAGRRPRRLPAPAPALAPAGRAARGQSRRASSACWPTSSGPVAGAVRRRGLRSRRGCGCWRAARRSRCLGVDKFPRMTDYVVPTGVRIADADRVRLGAHLAEGTTVMHEGFVNFNAGTLGASMVEGRISAGVVVGDGSDIGGGASIMGTLSGGGKEVISVGERCLVGANAGLGISLGDDCVVEAGLYVTAGTRVTLPDGDGRQGARAVRAATACCSGATARPAPSRPLARSGDWGGLNAALHAND